MKNNIKQIQQPRTKIVLRIAAVFGLLTFIVGIFLYFQFANPADTHAAVTGDYQSRNTGNWEGTTTWQRFNGTSWVNTTTPPTTADGVITILSGHTVTVTVSKNADQVIVNSGGTLVVNSGITLTLLNGAGKDLSVFGTLRNAGTVAGVNADIENTGTYQHNYTTTNGTIPTCNWATGSTCEIMGYTSNTSIPGNFNQSFTNFTWNCTSQTTTFNLNNNLLNLSGNFRISSTGSGQLSLINNSAAFNCGGNFTIAGGTLYLGSTAGQSPTLNIAGNYSQSNGTFNVVTATGSVGTINASGDWSHTGGTLTTGAGAGTRAAIFLSKTGTQTMSLSSNTISGTVDFTVNGTSILSMGTSILRGRNFTLLSGSTLRIGSSAGIASSGATGNIQSTGTRTFPATANYIYAGSSAQATGSGLPTTVNNLSIENSNNVTLTANVSVSGTLALTNGDVITGANELIVTNTSPGAITAYSASSYVIGKLRRFIGSSGSYDYPLGSSTQYELANILLSSVSGTASILGTFTASNPIAAGQPLRGVFIDNFTMNKMLDAGYWTLTPNATPSSGTYTATFSERGHTKSANYPNLYTCLYRVNTANRWESRGVHNSALQTDAGGTVTAVRSGLTAFGDFAIAYGVGFMIFENDSLISGVDGQPNATYLFRDVSEGIDAWIKIVSLNDGATLDNIDQFAGGYDEAWQPNVNLVANDTSSITWRITFKKMGTAVDTVLQYLSLMAVDVDGSPGAIRELVETNDYTTHRIAPNCSLNITKTGATIRAISDFVTFSNIDTVNTQAMFQIDKRNVSTITYTTGAVSIQGSVETRQNCLFFKPFFNFSSPLPIALNGFAAKALDEGSVLLNWSTASEKNNDFFTIERSNDGVTYKELTRVNGSGTTNTIKKYSTLDLAPLEGKSYYRLKQTDFNGTSETFPPVFVNFTGKTLKTITIAPNPFSDAFNAHFEAEGNEEVQIQLLNLSGVQVYSDRMMAASGNNTYSFTAPPSLQQGTYLLRISTAKKVIGTAKIICRKK